LKAKHLAVEFHKTVGNTVEDALRSRFAETKAKNKILFHKYLLVRVAMLHGADIDNNGIFI